MLLAVFKDFTELVVVVVAEAAAFIILLSFKEEIITLGLDVYNSISNFSNFFS